MASEGTHPVGPTRDGVVISSPQQNSRCGACETIFAEDAIEERGIITLNRRDPVTETTPCLRPRVVPARPSTPWEPIKRSPFLRLFSKALQMALRLPLGTEERLAGRGRSAPSTRSPRSV